MKNRLARDPQRRLPSRRRRGQNLTEFAVITFLVAVGTIGVVGLFGNNLRQLFGGSSDALAGSTSSANGGTKASAGLLKWSLKGSSGQGNPGGTSNMPPPMTPGNPGATVNASPGHISGNPGGTANAQSN